MKRTRNLGKRATGFTKLMPLLSTDGRGNHEVGGGTTVIMNLNCTKIVGKWNVTEMYPTLLYFNTNSNWGCVRVTLKPRKLSQLLLLLLLLLLTLKHISFSTILNVGLLVGYKGFSLISLNDKPLLEDGHARVFLLHMYMHPAWHHRQVRC